MYNINKDRLISTFIDLVKIDSESRKERKVGDYILNYLKNLKLDLSVYEDDTAKKFNGNCGNIICKVKGNRKDGKIPILFLVHIDTVTPCIGVNPIIRDETIYSDGTTILGADDKSACACIMEALQILSEGNIKYPDIEVVFTVGEEVGLLGATELDYSKISSKMAFAFDSGGSLDNIIVKAPRIVNVDAEFIGKPAHSGAAPEKGISAIQMAAEAISKMKLGRIDDDTTANIGVISGGEKTNIIPEKVVIKGEARSLELDKLDKQLKDMEMCISESAKKFGGKYTFSTKLNCERVYLSEKDEVVKIACTAIEKCGGQPKLKSSGGGSDASELVKNGIPCVVMSTGYENPHTKEEYIKINDMVKSVELMLKIMEVY